MLKRDFWERWECDTHVEEFIEGKIQGESNMEYINQSEDKVGVSAKFYT